MTFKIPKISNQLYQEDISGVLDRKYSALGSIWINNQVEWCNGVYSSFKDHDKFLIIIFLVKKTLDFYSRNFVKLTYEEFYSKETVEIEKFTISEISLALHIPKESARRKIQELENEGAIRKIKKKIVIDRSKFYYSKPIESIKRMSRFLATLSELCVSENFLLKKMTSEELELVIKDNFTYIWKVYYELQIPMLISYKKIFKDLETFHIYVLCVVNEHLYTRKLSKDYMSRDEFHLSMLSKNKGQGINAMSISDITSIPRATVIRKLKKLVIKKILTIDAKKHYKLNSDFAKNLTPVQKIIFLKLANFSTRVFNLILLKIKN
jgi:predicted transcriptional regulator